MPKLSYKIITPERVALEGEAESLTANTESGEITILPGHIPLATLLRAGEMRVKNAGKEELLAVSGGMLEVMHGNKVTIVAETAELSHELELTAISEAKKRAEEHLLTVRKQDTVGYADAAAHLERELARYRVVSKRKHKGQTLPEDER